MKKSLLIVIISLLVSMGSMVVVSPVCGPVLTTLYVDPPNIIDTTKTAGTNFTININVKDATDLFGYDLFLNYTTSVLTATNITLGPFFPPTSWRLHEEINDALGYVWYVINMPFESQVGETGSGTLATINFIVDSIGESPLDLCIAQISAKHEEDEWPVDITEYTTAYDGYFSNILRHTSLRLDPENITDPNLVPGNNFTININILNVTLLHSFEFKLGYDTALLRANVTEGDFLNSSGPTNFTLNINETLGFVWVNVTLVDPIAGATGDGNLATVTFNVTAIGECILDLYDTKLKDPEWEWIEHYAYKGYFSNEPIIHDIAITDIVTTVIIMKFIEEENTTFPEPKVVNKVRTGEKVNVTVSVKNNGTVTETCSVTAYYDNDTIGTKNVMVPEGFLETVTFEWNTEGVPVGNYIIWAAASVVEGEENTANNKFTMETEFVVLPKQSFPIELAVGAIVLIIAAAGIAVYFIKIRKPKSA